MLWGLILKTQILNKSNGTHQDFIRETRQKSNRWQKVIPGGGINEMETKIGVYRIYQTKASFSSWQTRLTKSWTAWPKEE